MIHPALSWMVNKNKAGSVLNDNKQVMGNNVITVKPSDYWLSLLFDYAPLFLLAFFMGMLRGGLKGLRSTYLGKSFISRMFNLVVRSTIGAAMAVGCALLMPLLKIDPDPTTMLGVVVFVSVCGVQIVDGVIYKYLGIHLVDVDASQEEAEWRGMDMETRKKVLEIYRQSLEKDDGENNG